jgi:hypothetical protein
MKLVIDGIKDWVVELSMVDIKIHYKNNNGTHFVQKVVQLFQEKHLQFMLKSILPNIVTFANNPHSLCAVNLFLSLLSSRPTCLK